MQKQTLLRAYQWIIIAIGIIVTGYSLSRLSQSSFDFRYVLLLIVTPLISSRISIKIPHNNTHITVSDTFIFLTALLYGVDAATILAAAEGISSGERISKKKKPVTILFSASVIACSTFAAASMAQLFKTKLSLSSEYDTVSLVITLCVLGFIQFIVNSMLVAIGLACKIDESVMQAWKKHCAWSSFSFFAGAASAGLIVSLVNSTGIIVLLVALPVIYILLLTYSNYINDIKETNAQTELLERERAEQAERHVEEQERHIAQLKRISKELEESREHFRYAAYHDDLTDLPNRLLLTEQLNHSIDKSKNDHSQFFALLFLDLDRFKYINDSLGHAAGDRLLVEIARRLERSLRPGDTVARLGGDEFAILLDGLLDRREAIRVAERIQDELTLPFRLSSHEVFTTASIGISFSNVGYDHPDNVLRDADTAMYHAKERGKARYEIFDSKMHADSLSRLKLENDLRYATERREFQVHYQPIVSLKNGKIAGFEALIRWQHLERGMVSPAEFIPLAEETGLINEIGEIVLYESCRQVQQWHSQLTSNKPFISVNLSGIQLAQPNFIEIIKSVLNETKLNPQYLKLEITESVVMGNGLDAELVLRKLRALGIKLSIDDFGTGYSSLAYLHRFPVNTLKIDQSFVSKMSNDDNTEIVNTIITLANNLGMNVVAEGIETTAQLAQLRRLGCNYGQGYLFSRPLTPRASFEFFKNNDLLSSLFLQTQNYRMIKDKNFGYVSESLM